MSVQPIRLGERSIAVGALEGLLVGVDELVLLQAAQLGETLAALFALEALLPLPVELSAFSSPRSSSLSSYSSFSSSLLAIPSPKEESEARDLARSLLLLPLLQQLFPSLVLLSLLLRGSRHENAALELELQKGDFHGSS